MLNLQKLLLLLNTHLHIKHRSPHVGRVPWGVSSFHFLGLHVASQSVLWKTRYLWERFGMLGKMHQPVWSLERRKVFVCTSSRVLYQFYFIILGGGREQRGKPYCYSRGTLIFQFLSLFWKDNNQIKLFTWLIKINIPLQLCAYSHYCNSFSPFLLLPCKTAVVLLPPCALVVTLFQHLLINVLRGILLVLYAWDSVGQQSNVATEEPSVLVEMTDWASPNCCKTSIQNPHTKCCLHDLY